MLIEKEKQPLNCFYDLMSTYLIRKGEILLSELDYKSYQILLPIFKHLRRNLEEKENPKCDFHLSDSYK